MDCRKARTLSTTLPAEQTERSPPVRDGMPQAAWVHLPVRICCRAFREPRPQLRWANARNRRRPEAHLAVAKQPKASAEELSIRRGQIPSVDIFQILARRLEFLVALIPG